MVHFEIHKMMETLSALYIYLVCDSKLNDLQHILYFYGQKYRKIHSKVLLTTLKFVHNDPKT